MLPVPAAVRATSRANAYASSGSKSSPRCVSLKATFASIPWSANVRKRFAIALAGRARFAGGRDAFAQISAGNCESATVCVTSRLEKRFDRFAGHEARGAGAHAVGADEAPHAVVAGRSQNDGAHHPAGLGFVQQCRRRPIDQPFQLSGFWRDDLRRILLGFARPLQHRCEDRRFGRTLDCKHDVPGGVDNVRRHGDAPHGLRLRIYGTNERLRIEIRRRAWKQRRGVPVGT